MNEQYIDTIHRYLSGAMPPPEQAAFEAEMQANPSLQNDVELERLLLAGLERDGATRQTIGGVHQKLKNEGFFSATAEQKPPELTVIHSTKQTTTMKRILAIAATFAVLALAVWFIQNQGNNGPDPAALFAKYYQPQDDVQRAKKVIAQLEEPALASAQTESDSLRQALQLYEAGNYAAAQSLLKSILENHPDNDTAQYYLGVVHISQGHYAKAIELLLPLSRSETSALKNDALWNLGLCFLQTQNGLSDAREAFTKLSNDNEYPNHRGAKALLEQLLPK